MPLFQFRVFDGRSEVSPDTVELSDLNAAHRDRIRRAGATLVLDAHVLDSNKDWRMDVTDEKGTLLFRYDFSITIAPAVREELR